MVRFKTGDIAYLKDTHEKVEVLLYSMENMEKKTLSRLSVESTRGVLSIDQSELYDQKEYRNMIIEELLNDRIN